MGSQNVRIGKASPGRAVDIMVNGRGQRWAANLIAVESKEIHNPARCDWTVGSDAETMCHLPTAICVPRFIDYLNHPDDFPLAILHPSEAAAIGLSLYANQANPKSDSIVITVPSDSAPQFRYALSEALKITKVKDSRVVDQNSAIAADYIIEKWNKRPKKVLFCDIGASRTELSLFSFEKIGNKVVATLLNFSSSTEINGNAIDSMIAERLFPGERLTKEDIHAISKAKEQLSAGSDTRISIQNQPAILLESLMVEELSAPLVANLKEMLSKFAKPDEIELLGGASRFIPFVQGIRDAMEIEPKRVMNSEEAAALGAAYIGALDAKIATGMTIEFRKPLMHTYSIKAGEYIQTIMKGEPSNRAKVTFSSIETNEIEISADGEPYLSISISNATGITITMDAILQSESYGVSAITDSTGSSIPYTILLSNKSLRQPENSSQVVERTLSFVKTLHLKRDQTHRIETYIIDTIERIKYDLDIEAVSTSDERSHLFDLLKATRNNITTETYSLKQLKNIHASVQRAGKDIIMRADERKERPAALKRLQKEIRFAEDQIKLMRADNRIKSLSDFIARTKEWKKSAEAQDPLKNPTILCKDIDRRAETLKKKLEDIKKAKQQENSRRRQEL